MSSVSGTRGELFHDALSEFVVPSSFLDKLFSGELEIFGSRLLAEKSGSLFIGLIPCEILWYFERVNSARFSLVPS